MYSKKTTQHRAELGNAGPSPSVFIQEREREGVHHRTTFCMYFLVFALLLVACTGIMFVIALNPSGGGFDQTDSAYPHPCPMNFPLKWWKSTKVYPDPHTKTVSHRAKHPPPPYAMGPKLKTDAVPVFRGWVGFVISFKMVFMGSHNCDSKGHDLQQDHSVTDQQKANPVTPFDPGRFLMIRFVFLFFSLKTHLPKMTNFGHIRIFR